MNIQGSFPLGLTGLISLLSKGLKNLLQHHSVKASVLQCSTFFRVQLLHPHMTTGKTMKVKVLVAQSCLTLCDPLDCSLPGSFVHGILQARILEWVAISFFRGSSQPRDWTRVSRIAGRFFTIWSTREALTMCTFVDKVMSLLFNTLLSRFVIAFLPRNKCLLISWLQSLSAVILEPKKIKS